MLFFRLLFLGPLNPKRHLTNKVIGICLVIILTAITQVGGIAVWLGYGAGNIVRKHRLPIFRLTGFSTFVIVYGMLSFIILPQIAPTFGTVALNCFSQPNSAYKSNSTLYCALNRHYVTPKVEATVEDLAQHMSQAYPGSVVTYLDAGFPFTGFPLLPHLSHNDGKKLDLALFYKDRGTGRKIPDAGSWTIGYWSFAPSYLLQYQPTCKQDGTWRWNADVIQFLFADLIIDQERTKEMAAFLSRPGEENPVKKLFLEPHLKHSLGLKSDKIRFAGCSAARHDDHVHIEVR